MSDKELITDIDALLDGTLDDLADMPEFKPFPIGTHKIKMRIEQKKIDGFSAFEVKLTAIETLELPAGSEESPVAAGDTTNVLYFMNHKNPQVAEMGQGGFKELMAAASDKWGKKTNRQLLEDINSSDECTVVTNKRGNKEKTKMYTGIEAVVF